MKGVTLVLCDCDRPELERVLDITLSGEAQPTFAFVDRPSARRLKRQSTKTTNKDTSADNATDTTIPLPPNLIGVAEDVGDGLVSCDVTGSIIQTTDLDAALRFVESSLLNLEAQAVSSQRQSELGTCGGSIGDWSANEVRYVLFSQLQAHCLPILVPEGTITFALTVCPYIAIYRTDTFVYTLTSWDDDDGFTSGENDRYVVVGGFPNPGTLFMDPL